MNEHHAVWKSHKATHKKNVLTWCISMYHVPGFAASKMLLWRRQKKICGCRGLLGRVILILSLVKIVFWYGSLKGPWKMVTIFCLSPVYPSIVFFIFSGKTEHQWFRNWWPANTCWLLHHQTSSHSYSRSLHGKSYAVSSTTVINLHIHCTNYAV